MAKNQFQSTEILKIRIPAFVNKVTGDYIVSGLDTCTLEIRRPDGTALPGGPHTATWDSNVHIWIKDVPTSSFVIGEWRVKATTSDANGLARWWIGNWGDYVDDITTNKNRIGTPVGASLSADVAAVKAETALTKTDTTSIKAKTDTLPASPANEVTVAAVQTDVGLTKTAALAAQAAAVATLADTTDLKKVALNRWKVIGTQLIIYENNGTSIFKTYDLKDSAGQPSATLVFERVPA